MKQNDITFNYNSILKIQVCDILKTVHKIIIYY